MGEKRERLIDPDVYSSTDDRSFKEQMQDLGVEVVEKKAERRQDHSVSWAERGTPAPKESPAEAEAIALIKAAGLEGLLSPARVLEYPKEMLDALLEEGMSSAKMAATLGISISAVSNLRKLYGISGRPKRRSRTTDEGKVKELPQSETKQPTAEVVEEVVLLSVKTIRTNAQAAGGEVLGTAKMLEKLGDLPVVVEIRVMEDLQA